MKRRSDGKTIAEMMVSSESDDWYSPERVLGPIRRHWGRTILDPWWGHGCRTAPIVGITKEMNAFLHDWCDVVDRARATEGLGRRGQAGALDAYSNPPYSAMTDVTAKIVREIGRGLEHIALVKASTAEEWFRHLVWNSASAACFMYGRLVHDTAAPTPVEIRTGKKNTALFSSVVVYHGPRLELFNQAFGAEGKVIWLR